MHRCTWVNLNNNLYKKYHDTEWGVPLLHDQALFELLILEGAQAGLSWEIVLNKRAHYKKAFDNFEINRVALYKQDKIESLLKNENLIRNRLKICSTIINAKIIQEIQKESGSFSEYIWEFVGNQPIKNSYKTLEEIPTKTDISIAMSKALKKKGMNFVGPTIMYSFMQAAGLVNDHITTCFRYNQI